MDKPENKRDYIINSNTYENKSYETISGNEQEKSVEKEIEMEEVWESYQTNDGLVRRLVRRPKNVELLKKDDDNED